MGTVIINGKMYDAQTGLMINKTEDAQISVIEKPAEPSMLDAPEPKVDSVNTHVQTHAPDTNTSTTIKAAVKTKRVSKQARLAQAIADEFAAYETPKAERKKVTLNRTHEKVAEKNPSDAAPTDKFIDKKIAKAETTTTHDRHTMRQPSWISNYVAGNNPIEIQPAIAKPQHDSSLKHEVSRSDANKYSRRPMRSQTLNRHYVHRPAAKVATISPKRAPASIAKHPDVHHFKPFVVKDSHVSQTLATKEKPVEQIAKPTVSPTQSKIETNEKPDLPFRAALTHQTEKKIVRKAAVEHARAINSSVLKDALINEQLSKSTQKMPAKRSRKSLFGLKSHRRFTAPTIITTAMALLVFGGYFAYVNMPSMSIRVAANKAGVIASTPYTPDGYSVDGAVAYTPGSITIKYKSNGGGDGYSIVEQKGSTSDSELQNLASDGSSAGHRTLNSDGTTLYISDNKAVWLSNDTVYTLISNGMLSEDQITRIATSV